MDNFPKEEEVSIFSKAQTAVHTAEEKANDLQVKVQKGVVIIQLIANVLPMLYDNVKAKNIVAGTQQVMGNVRSLVDNVKAILEKLQALIEDLEMIYNGVKMVNEFCKSTDESQVA